MRDTRLLYQLALHRYSDIGLGSVPTMVGDNIPRE